MPILGNDPRSLKRAQLRASSLGNARKKPTSEVAEAIATVEARKATIAQRAKMIAQQLTKSSPKRGKKKKRKEYIARGEERDIYTRGYRFDRRQLELPEEVIDAGHRLKGSGWTGKGQR